MVTSVVDVKTITPTTLREYDVVCGRVKLAYKHIGNQYYKKLIDEYREQYKSTTSRTIKNSICNNIINIIHTKNGRFVSFIDKKGPYTDTSLLVETSKNIAYEKVTHALRKESVIVSNIKITLPTTKNNKGKDDSSILISNETNQHDGKYNDDDHDDDDDYILYKLMQKCDDDTMVKKVNNQKENFVTESIVKEDNNVDNTSFISNDTTTPTGSSTVHNNYVNHTNDCTEYTTTLPAGAAVKTCNNTFSTSAITTADYDDNLSMNNGEKTTTATCPYDKDTTLPTTSIVSNNNTTLFHHNNATGVNNDPERIITTSWNIDFDSSIFMSSVNPAPTYYDSPPYYSENNNNNQTLFSPNTTTSSLDYNVVSPPESPANNMKNIFSYNNIIQRRFHNNLESDFSIGISSSGIDDNYYPVAALDPIVCHEYFHTDIIDDNDDEYTSI